MTVYIDMDGVIADFESWIKTILPDITEDDWRYSKGPWEVMDDNSDIVYRDLAPLHLLSHMNYLYNNLDNVVFLSAIPYQWCGTDKWDKAISNKLHWLNNNIENFKSTDAIFTKGASDKLNYLIPGDVLYDDREDTITKWNAAGGIGINVKGLSL